MSSPEEKRILLRKLVNKSLDYVYNTQMMQEEVLETFCHTQYKYCSSSRNIL